MLRNVKKLERCTVLGTDGKTGSIDDVYFSYYGYPQYWPCTTYWAWGLRPVVVPPDARVREEIEQAREREAAAMRANADSHLRSAREVSGYRIATGARFQSKDWCSCRGYAQSVRATSSAGDDAHRGYAF